MGWFGWLWWFWQIETKVLNNNKKNFKYPLSLPFKGGKLKTSCVNA